VIPNSCGGWLKSSELLCKKCNSLFGEKFDKDLAEQTNFLANFLNIKRNTGKPQNVEGVYLHSGEPATISPGGRHGILRPIVKQIDKGNHTSISIKARNSKEYKKILISLKRKYPKIDVEEMMTNVKRETQTEPIATLAKFSVDAKRSIVKSLINFYLISGGVKKIIAHLIPYLEGVQEYRYAYVHYPDNLIYEVKKGEVSNVIRIIGNPSERMLYGYIEIFNTYNYLVMLNNEYDGAKMNLTYAYDVLLNKQIFPDINLNYDRQSLINLFDKKNETPLANFQKILERIIEVGMIRQLDKNIQDIIIAVVGDYISLNPKAEKLPKVLELLINKKISEIQPYIIKFGNPTPEAPPRNIDERNKWLQERTKECFTDKGSH